MSDWYSVRKVADSFVLVEMKMIDGQFVPTDEITYLSDGDCLEFQFLSGNPEKHHIFMDNNIPKIFILYNRTYIPIAIRDIPCGVLLRFVEFATPVNLVNEDE